MLTRPIDALHVVVPARNEQALIGRCLKTLGASRDRLRLVAPGLDVGITVVLDACTDRTGEVVARFADVTAVHGDAGRVGSARALGITSVAGRVAHPERTWILNTDADTVVPVSWLAAQRTLAVRGWDLVVGTVQPDPADLDARSWSAWRVRHRLGEGHEHVHGANLGFLLAAYQQVGGYEDVRVHEDVRLVRALRATGRPHLATARTIVTTSGRRSGRAPAGFAAYVDAVSAPVSVTPSPPDPAQAPTGHTSALAPTGR